MLLTPIINGTLAFSFTLCLMYTFQHTIGEMDAEQMSAMPIINMYFNATHSVAATNALMSFNIIVGCVGDFSVFASVSRLTWAFARDGGLPFSDFFAYVNTQAHGPPSLHALICGSSGAPSAQDPRQCARVGCCALLSAGSHQHSVDDGLLRHHIPHNAIALHLVHAADHIPPVAQAEGSADSDRAVQARPLRHRH